MAEIENQQLQFFSAMDTGELTDIWKKNDRTAWSDDAFNTVEKILRGRGQVLEEQASAVSLTDPFEQTRVAKGFPLKRLWRGEEPLAVAYWLYGIGPNLALNLLSRLEATAPIQIGLRLVWITYFPIALVGIWRSAGRYTGFWLWSGLARFIVILGWVSLMRVVLDLLTLA